MLCLDWRVVEAEQEEHGGAEAVSHRSVDPFNGVDVSILKRQKLHRDQVKITSLDQASRRTTPPRNRSKNPTERNV